MSPLRKRRLFGWIFMFYVVSAVLSETRLCSQCSSEEVHDCETNPPAATTCTESVGTVCSIITTKDMNGKQISFDRSCSTVRSDKKGCLENPVDNSTMCYIICDEDGCNYATQIRLQPFCALVISFMAVLLGIS